jgi:hypothetical protein
MKKILLLVCVVISSLLTKAQVWHESFDGLLNGSTSDEGISSWTTVSPSGGAATFSKNTPVSGYEVFLIDNTGTEGTWTSEIINISSQEKVAIEITLYSNFTFSSDYIRCYYKINDGAEIQFGDLQGNNGLNITSAASAIVSGNTLQIIVRGMDNTAGNTNKIINGMAFDDVSVTSISVLYSRSSGNWNNNSTWSTEGFDGISCACTPNSNTEVVIGNEFIVSIPGAATAAGVIVENTSTLKFTGNTSLTMARGGTLSIAEGGILKNDSGKGTVIYGSYAYSIIVNGILSLGTFTTSSGSSISFSGNGSVDVENFIVSSGNGKTITLNTAGNFNISNDLNFQAVSSRANFINHGRLSIGNRILFASSTVSLTNNGTITAGSVLVNSSTANGNILTNTSTGTLTLGNINLNNGDFTLDNAGTINQSGNFSNVDQGSTFKNLSGSTWNFSGSGIHSRLFCNHGTNTFNYTAAGAQSVLVPADAYSNLTLSSSGLKSLTGNLDVNGNLNVINTAQLDVSASAYSIALAGHWSISSTHANPFSERTGTITFDGASNQIISSVLGAETFYNLTINKAFGNVEQSSVTPTDVVISNTLTLTNGAWSINGKTLRISNPSITAINRTGGCILSETSSAPYGYLKWAIGSGTGSYVFPFGKTRSAVDYIPFTFNVTNAGTGVGSVAVATYATNSGNMPMPAGVLNLHNAAGADNSTHIADRFWYITLDGYTTNPTANITFVATPSEVGSITTLSAQRWNSISGKWDAPKSGQSANPNSATVPGVTNFSPWMLSENEIPLPIELIYFKAHLENDIVNMEWQSAQEIDNDFYTVEKTIDRENYVEVAQISGAGTSKKKITYHAVDPNVSAGKSYYRLKQTDYSGRVTYFQPIVIEYAGPSGQVLWAYPIPSQSGELTIELKGYKPNEDLGLQIMDLQGKRMFSTEISTDSFGKFSEKILLKNPLPAGVYVIKAGQSFHMVKKFIIE